ncbi:helix-turn-helix protein [compost metagenome]
MDARKRGIPSRFKGADTMALREAFAAVLQLLREREGLTQHDVAGAVTQSHISQLEALKTSATLETSKALADALNLPPLALMALVHAAEDGTTPRKALEDALQYLSDASLLNTCLPAAPTQKRHPRELKASKARQEVQALKAQGLTQAEIMKLLGLPQSTVSRHWHAST